jgi:biotin transport system substrate-specific component
LGGRSPRRLRRSRAVTLAVAAAPRPAVLADAIPRTLARDAVLVLAAALLTAACAQIDIPVPGSPVPISGQTFAVLLTGAALGARRGALGQALYVVLGLALPFYAGGTSGSGVLFGATGGYLVGFVIAGWLVGRLAEVRQDRTVPRAFVAFSVGQLVIFGIGVPWLAVSAGLTPGGAIAAGFTPFILGGIVKSALAGLLLPGAWKLVGRVC